MKRATAPLAVLALLALPVPAQVPLVTASLLNGWQTENGTQMTGLRLQLQPGWKTYWRAPGDAGIPPSFDWSASDNVASVLVHWPAPHVFAQSGIRSIGYSGDVVLPVEVTPRDPARPVRLVGQVDIGVCRDVCVPVMLRLDAQVAAPGAADPAIKAALAARPAVARTESVSCGVEPISDGLRVQAEMTLPSTGGDEVVVIEPGEPGVWVSESAVARDGNRLVAVAEMVGPTGVPFALDRSAIRITVLGDRQVVEISGCPGG